MNRANAFRAVFWLCALTILLLALLPTTQTLPTTGWDKSNHLLAFLTLSLLGLLAYPEKSAVTVLWLVAYGGLIEVLQSLTPHRLAEWGDWLADAIGVGIAWLLMRMLSRYYKT